MNTTREERQRREELISQLASIAFQLRMRLEELSHQATTKGTN